MTDQLHHAILIVATIISLAGFGWVAVQLHDDMDHRA